MNVNNQILSDITVHMKYAKHLHEVNRRETWYELVDRNKEMHLKKFPELTTDIEWAYQYVLDKKVLPSMRGLQFSGKPIDINPARGYNCAYVSMNDTKAFQEIMYLLLSGCGVGLSVQRHHVEKLPEIRKPNVNNTRRYMIGDSIIGWSNAIKALMKSYFGQKNIKYIFDPSDIREKGATLITSGGKAPGSEPLMKCLNNITTLLDNKKNGAKLTTSEVADVCCYIADAVLAGGRIR